MGGGKPRQGRPHMSTPLLFSSCFARSLQGAFHLTRGGWKPDVVPSPDLKVLGALRHLQWERPEAGTNAPLWPESGLGVVEGWGLAAWPSRQAGLLQDGILPFLRALSRRCPPLPILSPWHLLTVLCLVHLTPWSSNAGVFGVADLLYHFSLEFPGLAHVQVPHPGPSAPAGCQ